MSNMRLFEKLGDSKIDLRREIFEARVVGTTFQENAQELLKTLSTVDRRMVVVEFEREPENKYDSNAVKVITGVTWSKKKYFIGYIDRETAEFLAYVIDSQEYKVKVAEVKILGGEKAGVDNYGMFLKYKLEKVLK